MANTLQRSSVSFRRQGSSGRVWDNFHPDRKYSGISKSGPLVHTTNTGMGHAFYIKSIESDRQGLERREINHANSSASPRTPAKPQHKDQSCCVLACFRQCVGSSA